jgi:AraC-like DNA-binding protein
MDHDLIGGREQVFDFVHAKVLRCFPELVAELGGEPGALLRQAGIDDHADRGAEITYRQMVRLMELAAAWLRCPDFGLRLAMLQSGGGIFGPLGLVMKNSKTFGGAIDYVRGHAHAHSPAARIWLQALPFEQAVFVGHEILLERVESKRQAMEQVLLAGHLAAKEITGGQARARRVDFRHQPLLAPRHYRRYFECEVRFGQSKDGMLFFERDLACPTVDPDARAYRAATAYIDAELTGRRTPLHAQARGVIMQFLGSDRCSNDQVAAELNLHPRTLHRRLGAEGTSFHRIKDEVRRDLALLYLQQTDLEVGRISEKLGFSEQSVMTRRCSLWFSASPTKVRSQVRYIRPGD